jgi:branched-chain amino acid transport system substrate-binding protein
VVQPLSTGMTFALTEKAPVDKIPLVTAGYGRSESPGRFGLQVELPAHRHLLDGRRRADAAHRQEGRRLDKLKGKKIALVYHDSPYGKEPIPLLQERARCTASSCQLLPVAHPGVEQKAAWLQIRQNRPDYVLLWGWGVMNTTSLKEAQATGYPREKMYGVWWAGAEPDVKDVGRRRQGLQRADHAARRRARPRWSRTSSRRCMARVRAPAPRKRSARCSTCAA